MQQFDHGVTTKKGHSTVQSSHVDTINGTREKINTMYFCLIYLTRESILGRTVSLADLIFIPLAII